MCASRTLHIFRDPVGSSLSVYATMMPHLSMMPHLWTSVWRSASWYLEPWSGASPKWGALAKSLAREKTEGRFASCWAEAGAAACGLSLGALET